MNQNNNGNENNKKGGIGTPGMTLNLDLGEEDIEFLVSTTTDDGKDSDPHGMSLPERVAVKTRNRLLRTLYQAGKLTNALKEIDNMNLDVLGISECRWTDNGTIVKDVHIIIYSGGKEQKTGVGIILGKEIARSLIGYWAISERVTMIKLQGKPFNRSIIQIYAPTQDHLDNEIELFYDEIQTAIRNVKKDDILFVMGDLYAKGGKEKTTDKTGQYG